MSLRTHFATIALPHFRSFLWIMDSARLRNFNLRASPFSEFVATVSVLD